MANRIQKVKLEKLAKEKLPKQTVKNIDSIDVEVWGKAESGLCLNVSRSSVEFRLSYKTSTKKFLAWLGGITATVAGVITILKWLVPILVVYFANPPP